GGAGGPGGPARRRPPVALGVGQAVAADLRHQALAQRVDDAGADAVQAAGDLVGVVVELAAGVQRGEDHLQRALAGLGVGVDGDAPAVVGHGDGLAVRLQGHDDPRGVAVHHLVDRVVDDLPEQVVQPRFVDAPDVHAGA